MMSFVKNISMYFQSISYSSNNYLYSLSFFEYISKNNSKSSISEKDIGIDGTLVNPNKTDPMPSAVGASVNTQPIRQTAKEQMYGEKFVKYNLGVFGEDESDSFKK